jgi:hypothetical protein
MGAEFQWWVILHVQIQQKGGQGMNKFHLFGAMLLALILTFIADSVFAATPEETFPTSLHARGPSNGRENIYEHGLGKIVKSSFRDSACQSCHTETYADGTPVGDEYQPSCRDCHVEPGDSVDQERCRLCHTIGFDRFSVHREAELACMDCHTLSDVHGNGQIQESMYAPGAIEAECLDCHEDVFDIDNVSHNTHKETVHCSACHLETSQTCYSCHYESFTDGGGQYRVLTRHSDFVMLVNDQNGKVHTATYQTVPYKGKIYVGITPNMTHTIMKADDARNCQDCHNNDAVQQYRDEGRIWVAKWDEEKKSLWLRKGVIPVPPDWSYRLKFDQITYVGKPDDEVPGYPAEDPENWTYVGNIPNRTNIFAAQPLTREQMEKLLTVQPEE